MYRYRSRSSTKVSIKNGESLSKILKSSITSIVAYSKKIVSPIVICCICFSGAPGSKDMAPVIDLYYFPASAPCRAVMLTAKLLGVKLNLKTVNILEGEHMSPEFVRVSFCNQFFFTLPRFF